MKYKTYPKMKDSGIDWIGNIPEEWKIRRLKFTTKFDLSTVDRHENDKEIKVSICHYPQVYNNEKITDSTQLSSGTCNQKEIEKFRLKKSCLIQSVQCISHITTIFHFEKMYWWVVGIPNCINPLYSWNIFTLFWNFC